MKLRTLTIAGISGLFVYGGSAQGGMIGYDAEYRADYTDNAFQSQSNENKVDELTHNYRLSFFGNLTGSRSKSDFIATMEYRDYQDDTSSDKALSSFLGSSEIALTSRTLSWYVADALGYFDSDPNLRFNTRDQERVNYFVTGPKVLYSIAADKDVGGKLFYTNHNRDGRDLDYDKLNLDMFWDQYLNIRDNWGVSLEHTLMLYPDEADRGDYTITDLNTYFTRKTQANIYSFTVGVSYLQTEDEKDDTSANFDVSLDHLFTRRTGLLLEAGYNLSDESVLQDTQLTQTGQFEATDESGLFYESRLGAKYYYKGVRSDFDFGGEARELEYVDGPQQSALLQNDHYTYSLYTNYKRFVGRSLDVGIGLEAGHKDYIDSEFEDTLYTTTLTMDYVMSRSLDLETKVEYFQGEGNLPSADGSTGDRSYDEYLISVGLHWDPYKSRRSRNEIDAFDLSVIN